MHLMIDTEPHPSPIDSWIFGNVSQIFVQKSQAFISEFPSVAATKPLNNHAAKKIMQEEQTKSRSRINKEKLKEEKEEETVILQSKPRPHGVVDESKKANGYSKKNNYSSFVHEQRNLDNVDSSAVRKKDNFDKKNKADLFPKIMKKKEGDNNSNSKKQQEIKNARRSSKNLKQNKTKVVLLWEKEAAATIPPLPR